MMQLAFFEGVWKGEGEIYLSISEGPLPVTITVEVVQTPSKVLVVSTYQVEGGQEPVCNSYEFSGLIDDTFHVHLSNPLWKEAKGIGKREKNFIGLEFPLNESGFEGFEAYEFEDTKSCRIHAEYLSYPEIESRLLGTLTKCSKHSYPPAKK